MPEIPIPPIKLPDDVVKAMQPPMCDLLKLPTPQKLNLCLPFGGQVQGIVDVTKAIPDDCSLTFSILLQLPPLMASLGCFVKLLKVIEPMIDLVTGLTKVPPDAQKIAAAAPKLAEAAVEIAGCFMQIQTGIPKFVRDMLHMIAKLLKCIAQQLLSIAELMSGLEISIKTAEAAGNKALLEQLQCAKDNAKAQSDAVMGSMDMIAAVLAVAEPFLALAGVSLSLPTIGSAEDAFAVEQAANTMLSIGASIDQIASSLDALGSC